MTRTEKNKIIWDNLELMRKALLEIWLAYIAKEDPE